MTRRAFLAAAALFAPVGKAFGLQSPGSTRRITRAEFLRLSERLAARRGLDAAVGATYLDALLAVPGNGPRLATLARGVADPEMERTILECWYTGIYTINGERRVATHTGALMWMALGVPAPSICGGLFGAWSQPPRKR